ncbi:Appr-1-p processing protein [miscellaneous Crenarchaeota group archaeon SMTZ-80]|jgi:O-acetyl-ADP-ribose deacetylase (regulator of RNase III)|nr:MAG: Appr-1-p processing protein [miscellaneous Crenarchaeota group archaeon SMTZ-80]
MNIEVDKKEIIPGKYIKLIEGDITEEKVDAVINAANSYLKHGGGLAGAIVRKGGVVIQKESNRIGFVPVGQVALTSAGNLPAKFIIHAVGPRWGEGDEDNKLIHAVQNSLELAERKYFKIISIPAISTGIFGFPKDQCARIIIKTIEKHLQSHPERSLKEIRICLLDKDTLDIFRKEF